MTKRKLSKWELKNIEEYEKWKYSPEGIDYTFDRDGIPDYARGALAKALSLLPKEVIDYVIENCLFISIESKQKGTYWSLRHYLLKDKKGFILLPEDIWDKKPIQINFTVAHEVAHACKDDVVIAPDLNSSPDLKDEIEADKMAVKWLSEYYKKESLKKICSYWGK